jgi:hypothetical protein
MCSDVCMRATAPETDLLAERSEHFVDALVARSTEMREQIREHLPPWRRLSWRSERRRENLKAAMAVDERSR